MTGKPSRPSLAQRFEVKGTERAVQLKGRGVCPSCLGRKMCQTALNLTEHVLPLVPLRRVFTLPHPFRVRLGYDAPRATSVSLIGSPECAREITCCATLCQLPEPRSRLSPEDALVGGQG